MPPKSKIIYTCQKCGAQFPKWMGQCTDCNAWNSLTEEMFIAPVKANSRFASYAGINDNEVMLLANVKLEAEPRVSCGYF